MRFYCWLVPTLVLLLLLHSGSFVPFGVGAFESGSDADAGAGRWAEEEARGKGMTWSDTESQTVRQGKVDPAFDSVKLDDSTHQGGGKRRNVAMSGSAHVFDSACSKR